MPAYVICAALHNVPDVFNVENLWTRARRRQTGQFLQEALEHHPRTQGRRHQSVTYFSHIIVQVPKADYLHDDDLHAGSGAQTLRADLQDYHKQMLGTYVASGEDIRYRIEPNPDLPAGEVRFRFGPAIYVPADDETPLYRLYRQTEATNQSLGLIYPGQRLSLLNGDPNGSTYPVPDWPFGPDASLLLRPKPESEAGLEVAARPENSLIVSPPRTTSTRHLFEIRNPAGASLTLMIAPYAAAITDGPIEEPTWTPGSDLPGAHLRLRVVGVALQRLSSRAPTGLVARRLAFNHLGQLVRSHNPDVAACLRIDAADQLWGEIQQESTPLSPPMTWAPQDGLTLELSILPEALQADYLGWLRLPQPIPLPMLAGRWCCFGRGQGADIAPALFNDADAWQWAKDQVPVKQPEQLLLSRQHVRLRADAQGWTVKLASQTWPVYLLDAAGGLTHTLIPTNGEREQDAARGALLIVGGYVLELG